MDRSGTRGRGRGAAVATHDLTKHYGEVVALDSLDLGVRAFGRRSLAGA